MATYQSTCPHRITIDGMLEAAQEQYETLQPARVKPHVLDNYTVGRVTEVFTTQKNDLWLFDEQLKRWAAQSLTPGQRQEVQRLTGQMATLRQMRLTRFWRGLKHGS